VAEQLKGTEPGVPALTLHRSSKSIAELCGCISGPEGRLGLPVHVAIVISESSDLSQQVGSQTTAMGLKQARRLRYMGSFMQHRMLCCAVGAWQLLYSESAKPFLDTLSKAVDMPEILGKKSNSQQASRGQRPTGAATSALRGSFRLALDTRSG
jgi:hypothetical protein